MAPEEEAAAEEEVVRYIAPTLSSDADPYDPEHPENLDEDQLYAKSAILIEAKTGNVIFEKEFNFTKRVIVSRSLFKQIVFTSCWIRPVN